MGLTEYIMGRQEIHTEIWYRSPDDQLEDRQETGVQHYDKTQKYMLSDWHMDELTQYHFQWQASVLVVMTLQVPVSDKITTKVIEHGIQQYGQYTGCQQGTFITQMASIHQDIL